MSGKSKIESSPENWEAGVLGADESHIKIDTSFSQEDFDKAAGLQMISIRLPKAMIDDLKKIAGVHGINYQPLIKQTLHRFVECEVKRMFNE